MESGSDGKSTRLLTIYSRLANGETLSKAQLAQEFHVTERSVQRDMEDLRTFVHEQMLMQEIVYDARAKGYRLANPVPKSLTNSEILAVCKILLESRSMRRDEMMPILDKLIACCVPAENRKAVGRLVANERFHYVEPHHGHPVLNGLWEIGQAIQHQNVMEIGYLKMGSTEVVERTIEPVGLLFSEYYFYLVAFIRDIDRNAEFENPGDLFPTIYRIDRIRAFRVLEEHFRVPYRTGSRRASSASGCSSCTAGSFSASGSGTPAPPSRPSWTVSPPPGSLPRTSPAGPWRPRYSARGSTCGSGVKGSMYS